MDELDKFQSEFIDNCCYRMDESLRMLKISVEKVSEEQLWQKPNASLNSIGNLILHLCGNMTQYGIASLNETEDKRERNLEFSTEGGFGKDELMLKIKEVIEEVKSTFRGISLERLLSQRQVQGFKFSGIGNMVHVVEHLSYHTGQIAFWVKQLKNEQLGFYDGHDLNTKNCLTPKG